jgi:glyoxylase-like metal-dependent hydrolase (beta-lactamase superfamily II)
MKLHSVQMGITRCYIIQDKETIMIDSGPPNKVKHFTENIQKVGIDPKQITLIIHTHGHFDHVGSAKDIFAKAILSNS